MRRILFVNMFFEPSIAASAQHLSDLARHLATRGWRVDVLCSNRLYEAPGTVLLRTVQLGGVRVRRLPLHFFTRTGVTRALAYLEFLGRAFVCAFSLPRPDVCVTLTTPPFLLLIGAVFRLRGSRHLHWSLDLYPEVACALGALRGSAALLLVGLRNLLWKLTDCVVALGSFMKGRLLRTGLPARKLTLIPAWAKAQDFPETTPPRGPFVLLYSGNMGKAHEFETALRAARKLPEVRFVFVGDGARMSEVERAARDLSNVSLRSPVPRSELGELFSSATAQLVTLDPRADGLLVPSKMFGAMASGRPVMLVASAHNDLAQALKEGDSGFRIEPGDVDGFVHAVRTLAARPELVAAMGRKARGTFLDCHELKPCARAFVRLLARLI